MKAAYKILVVDDEIGICRNVEKILSKNNYQVTHAQSAKVALEKMAKESYSLLISDIIMPEVDGIELLKRTKEQWPSTKVVMMTAYASTDTAMKAIRLGAEDYVPKPFTPDGLRDKVEKVLSPKTILFPMKRERTDLLDGKVDIDLPFDRKELLKYVGKEYLKTLGPSDMPSIGRTLPKKKEIYCPFGQRICDVFAKLGHTCKAGTEKEECPQKKAMERKAQRDYAGFDSTKLIGIDMPFNYAEVISVAGPEFVKNLNRDGFSFIPYHELKKNVAQMMANNRGELLTTPEFSRHILVIDDEVAVNNNIRKILSKKGYHVDQAITKAEAIRKIDESSYKLILLDLRIPGVRDLELLKIIRDKRPETKVIIVTGYANIETAVETAKLGAIDFLSKPFTPRDIRMAAENALKMAA
ncbi:Protein with response regulator receiver domain [uncultured Desulfobacterium sp.]|uniref:Protein with response regulator receiver domain n=1 Tax=uncultured Desulfobacterium sp. TaxID=201089 RepID=A0A445MRG0_9BACT|nr:Protein with response regulator receiver domain [uncultured Desulfobacterium sp.]